MSMQPRSGTEAKLRDICRRHMSRVAADNLVEDILSDPDLFPDEVLQEIENHVTRRGFNYKAKVPNRAR